MYLNTGLIMIVALLPLGLVYGQGDDEDEIEQCRNIAMPMRPGYVPTVERGDSISFFVDKVTVVNDELENTALPQRNICSPLSYFKGQECDTIYYQYTLHTDSSRTIKTVAESKVFKDIVEITNIAQITDSTHYIFQGKFYKMELLQKDHPPRVIPYSHVPQLVKRTQGQLFALVARHPDENWELYSTCDGRVSWAVIRNTLDTFLELEEMHEQIDEVIRVHGVQRKSCMIQADAVFMFPIRIYSISATILR